MMKRHKSNLKRHKLIKDSIKRRIDYIVKKNEGINENLQKIIVKIYIKNESRLQKVSKTSLYSIKI